MYAQNPMHSPAMKHPENCPLCGKPLAQVSISGTEYLVDEYAQPEALETNVTPAPWGTRMLFVTYRCENGDEVNVEVKRERA